MALSPRFGRDNRVHGWKIHIRKPTRSALTGLKTPFTHDLGEGAKSSYALSGSANPFGDPDPYCTVIALVTVTPASPFFFGTKDATTV